MIPSTDHRPDAALVAAARTGDRDAFAELVRRHQRSAVLTATFALGSATDADEVAQEAFVKAFAALARFDESAAFRPWLLRIVTNTARNRHRFTRRQQHLMLRVAAQVPVTGPAPEEVAGHRAEAEAMVRAINRLRVADRLILSYRWYEQMTEAEIAVALGCPAGTVKSRLSRAMGRLRREIEREVVG